MKDVIIMVGNREVKALDIAIEELHKIDDENKKGMYVCPNKITDAIGGLKWLRLYIQKELRDDINAHHVFDIEADHYRCSNCNCFIEDWHKTCPNCQRGLKND